MRYFTTTILAVLCSIAMYAQDITGQWNGILKVQGTQLRIVFHITKTDAAYSATMDSPDQNANGIPVSEVSFQNGLLKLSLSSAGIAYDGILDKEEKITGNFKQGGLVIPMELTKGVQEKKAVLRPQEPVKPYPYFSEEVTFANARDKITLAGTLSLPKKEGVFPVAILITGSGPENRDEEAFGHKPFLVLADHLTRNGIAVLRFDDRGTFASTGDFKSATTNDFASDVEAAITYLKSRKEINKKAIGLIGHSEGGLIAPIVASKQGDVAFIVLMAGPGVPGDQILLLQKELIERGGGASEGSIQIGQRLNRELFDIVKRSTDSLSMASALTLSFKKVMTENPDFKLPGQMTEDQFIKPQVAQLTSPWMRNFISYDPSPVLQKVKCPVLVLNGSKDLQVPPKQNLAAIQSALGKGGNKRVTAKELPGLNHMFQEAKTGLPAEYAEIEQTISPLALDEITQWILKL